jgi:hypothetical protein
LIEAYWTPAVVQGGPEASLLVWESMMGDEYADEAITANGYTFTAGGRRFG